MAFFVLYYRFPLKTLLFFLPAAAIPIAEFFWTNYQALGRLLPAYFEFGGPWYDYPGSHWNAETQKHGIDWAHLSESPGQYAFHLLVGHHGFFSLTPIYLLALVGAIGTLLLRPQPPRTVENDSVQPPLKLMAGLTLSLTGILLTYYLFLVGEARRNYGGVTNGPRWLMWLTPFWLLTLLPAADWLSKRPWPRRFACLLLLLSVFSACTALWMPWRHPWLYRLLHWTGMISYN